MSCPVHDVDLVANRIIRCGLGGRARVLAIVVNTTSRVQQDLNRTFDTIAGTLSGDEGDPVGVVNGFGAHIDQKHVVVGRILVATKITISIFEVERHPKTVLLKNALTQSVFRHPDKLYFWFVGKIRWVDTPLQARNHNEQRT